MHVVGRIYRQNEIVKELPKAQLAYINCIPGDLNERREFENYIV